jgi:hypothetical protein
MEISMEDDFDDIEPRPKRRLRLKLTPILGSLTPFILIFLTIFYITTFQKDAVEGFLKKYDFIGLSEIGQNEKQRLYQINNLPIPFEQRQALVNGTVFLGASKQMVGLALGAPYGQPQIMADGTERWVYFFQDSSRPTYLFFKNDMLANAAKGTTLDNAEIQ